MSSDGSYTDLSVIVPALLGAGASTLESIYQLPPPRHRAAAEVLTRSLVEYAITFAWLAAPVDDEEREGRLQRFEMDEYLERERADKKYTTVLPERGALYRELIAAGDMPDGLLGDAMRQRIAAFRERGGKPLPDLLSQAVQADAVWTEEIEEIKRSPIAGIYASAYQSFSFVSHASVTAVDRFVRGAPPDLVVGAGASLDGRRGPYGFACSVFTLMLRISSRRFGVPDEQAVRVATTPPSPRLGAEGD